jgi:hypothetical protein
MTDQTTLVHRIVVETSTSASTALPAVHTWPNRAGEPTGRPLGDSIAMTRSAAL